MSRLTWDLESENFNEFTLLLVGVGGIGCEVLKYLSKSTFKQLFIVDLDDIELSNLNRQFYFKQEHIGKSKSAVAAEVFSKIAPQLKIKAFQDTIYSSFFNSEFYRNIDAVILALDNQEARSYVNKQCIKYGIPIFESGTFGFMGQTYPILPKVTRCYDCSPRPSQQKGLQICTVRTNPTKPEHVLFWAKNVFNNMFDLTMTEDTFRIFDCVISMTKEDSLKSFYNQILSHFSQTIQSQKTSSISKFGHLQVIPIETFEKEFQNFIQNISDFEKSNENENHCEFLKSVFIQKINCSEIEEVISNLFHIFRLLIIKRTSTSFDKDDDLHVAFVQMLTALRCQNFKIPLQSFDDVRTKIGQIIPAISSTNSIVAGLVVQELLKYLYKLKRFNELEVKRQTKFFNAQEVVYEFDEKLREIFLTFHNFESYISNAKVFKMIKGQFSEPNEDCRVCQREYFKIRLNFKTTFERLQNGLIEKFGTDFILFFNNQTILESFEGSFDQSCADSNDTQNDDENQAETKSQYLKNEIFSLVKEDINCFEIDTLLIRNNVEKEEKGVIISIYHCPEMNNQDLIFEKNQIEQSKLILWKTILNLKNLLQIKRKIASATKKVDLDASCFTILDVSEVDSIRTIRSYKDCIFKTLESGKKAFKKD